MNFTKPEESPFYTVEASDDEDENAGTRKRLPKPTEMMVPQKACPGPAEAFEDDFCAPPPAAKGLVAARRTGSGDWQVDGLTPKLREYISVRFKESSLSEAGNNFICVTMRPHARAGAAAPSAPVNYSIARIDVIDFERLCGRNLEETRMRLDYLKRCRDTLNGMLQGGARECEYVPNTLPYSFQAGPEFKGLLNEAETATFGQVEGFRPVILIDASGALADSLVYIRTALKRMMYSFMAAKSKFNLVKFTSGGRAEPWTAEMVPPTAQVLREAEDWLSSVKPLRGSPNLMDGIRLALAYEDVDVVYVLTSGLPHRCDVEYTLKNLRSMNVRDLPIHVIGIDCEPTAELHLRRLASENSGSFRSKRFDSVPSMMTTLNRTRSGVTDTEDSRMTIAGQLKILEVMTEESESQECDWLEEQKCANRLLFTTASQAPVPDVETSRIMTRRAASADVHRHKGSSQRTLREMLQLGSGSPGEDIERTPTAKNGRKLPSMPRPPVQAKGLGDALAKRPSVANPWDRPGGTIRVSEVARMGGPRSSSACRSSSARRSSSRGPR